MLILSLRISKKYIECPYHLVLKKQFELSRFNLNYIGEVNGRNHFDFLYEEEIMEKNVNNNKKSNFLRRRYTQL
jgi:hypothetical protein